MPTPDNTASVYSITRLVAETRAALENSFPLLWIRGEISNLATPKSGHLYFTLKDIGAQVRCAMFRNKRNLLRMRPENGMEVLVRAQVTLYEPRGDFQLRIEHMEEAGSGALQRQFDELKQELRGEGLFDPARKQPLPASPRCIGVITSAHGAAIRDVLHVLNRRAPWLRVVVYPSQVQGAQAPSELVAALRTAQTRAECDLLLITRGGGSREDLNAFNDEGLARAIADCEIPIVSAVGHEIDVSISDLVADAQAPTPSAAAERISPDRNQLLARFRTLETQLVGRMDAARRNKNEGFQALANRLNRTHPVQRLRTQQQRLDEMELRLRRHTARRLGDQRQHCGQLLHRLSGQSPARKIVWHREYLNTLSARLPKGTTGYLRNLRRDLGSHAARLHSISPLATLGRGYALIQRASDQALVHDSKQAPPGTRLTIRLAHGGLDAQVTDIDDEP